jgi:hypothetical protein
MHQCMADVGLKCIPPLGFARVATYSLAARVHRVPDGLGGSLVGSPPNPRAGAEAVEVCG